MQNTTAFVRRRNFFLVLPLLILPFLILFFIVMGGGKGNNSAGNTRASTGLNVKLPDAQFKKGKEKTKLLLYEEAGRDSVMLAEKIKNDPYYSLKHQYSLFSDPSRDSLMPRTGINNLFPRMAGGTDENEAKIMEKLARLKSVIQQKSAPGDIDRSQEYSYDQNSSSEKLTQPKTQMNIHDPRMDQITSMLDKVMAIQHPEILEDSMARLRKQNKNPALPVNLNTADSDPETFGPGEQDQNPSGNINRFFLLTGEKEIENDPANAIEAVAAETQALVSGSVIKFRLLDDIRIKDHFIGKNQFIYGITALAGERLKIQFSSIRSGQNILPVALEAYDMDGLAGIYIPGSINRDVAKESSDRAIGSIGLTSLDSSIGAQAAGAGIQAAKTLLSRKVKLLKVTVKAGYKVLLKDSREK